MFQVFPLILRSGGAIPVGEGDSAAEERAAESVRRMEAVPERSADGCHDRQRHEGWYDIDC